MPALRYYWVNVFTTKQDQGNPLPVVILEETLSKQSMQAIAKIFNQSETVFIENAEHEQPQLHIYTPMQELPFAGHPIIGALEVLTEIQPSKRIQTIRCNAGLIDTHFDNNNIHWIKAPVNPTSRASTLDIKTTGKMLGLESNQILHAPVWINSGSEQLLVQIQDFTKIDNIQLNAELFAQHATLYAGRTMIYLWAIHPDGIYCRYLYLKNGIIGEDSGTGSAAANLGGWHLLQDQTNIELRIQQGTLLGQESILYLQVNDNREIWIGGQNRMMGTGELLWEV